MRKLLFSMTMLVAVVITGCSFDAERALKDEVLPKMDDTPEVSSTECFSSTATKGLELKICANRDSTYTIFYGGVNMKTIDAEGLEGKTPEDFVAESCQLDELDFDD